MNIIETEILRMYKELSIKYDGVVNLGIFLSRIYLHWLYFTPCLEHFGIECIQLFNAIPEPSVDGVVVPIPEEEGYHYIVQINHVGVDINSGSLDANQTYEDVAIEGSWGENATAKIMTDANGDITSVTITAPGEGYRTGEGVTMGAGNAALSYILTENDIRAKWEDMKQYALSDYYNIAVGTLAQTMAQGQEPAYQNGFNTSLKNSQNGYFYGTVSDRYGSELPTGGPINLSQQLSMMLEDLIGLEDNLHKVMNTTMVDYLMEQQGVSWNNLLIAHNWRKRNLKPSKLIFKKVEDLVQEQ
jgi:hypothetical protein